MAGSLRFTIVAETPNYGIRRPSAIVTVRGRSCASLGASTELGERGGSDGGRPSLDRVTRPRPLVPRAILEDPCRSDGARRGETGLSFFP
jgi:hypothetical protein